MHVCIKIHKIFDYLKGKSKKKTKTKTTTTTLKHTHTHKSSTCSYHIVIIFSKKFFLHHFNICNIYILKISFQIAKVIGNIIKPKFNNYFLDTNL